MSDIKIQGTSSQCYSIDLYDLLYAHALGGLCSGAFTEADNYPENLASIAKNVTDCGYRILKERHEQIGKEQQARLKKLDESKK